MQVRYLLFRLSFKQIGLGGQVRANTHGTTLIDELENQNKFLNVKKFILEK